MLANLALLVTTYTSVKQTAKDAAVATALEHVRSASEQVRKEFESIRRLLEQQLNGYSRWLSEEMMPHARNGHRLPEAIYADNLKNFGVDMDPHDLIRAAQLGFGEIRNEMQAIAHLIAEQQVLPSGDYRSVMPFVNRNTTNVYRSPSVRETFP